MFFHVPNPEEIDVKKFIGDCHRQIQAVGEPKKKGKIK
jgi:hypothetical protein